MKREHLLSLWVVVALILSTSFSIPTWAGPEDDIRGANQMALEFFDLGEYSSSIKELQKNQAKLRKQGMGGQPIEAETLVLMGVVQARGLGNDTKAVAQFKRALEIDREVSLPKRAGSISKELFEKTKADLYPNVDCGALLGMSHNQMTQGQEGVAVPVEVKADQAIQSTSSLVLMYRGGGKGAYKAADFVKTDECNYRAEVPGEAVTPPNVEYYIEAKLKDGRLGAKKGGVKKPFSVNVIFGAAQVEPENEAAPDMESIARSEDENPDFAGRPPGPKGSGCAGCTSQGGASHSGGGMLMIAVLFGFALWVSRRRISARG